MPNLRIRRLRVVRFSPRRVAAPLGPPTTQFDSLSAQDVFALDVFERPFVSR
jgi:hypothetical protein